MLKMIRKSFWWFNYTWCTSKESQSFFRELIWYLNLLVMGQDSWPEVPIFTSGGSGPHYIYPKSTLPKWPLFFTEMTVLWPKWPLFLTKMTVSYHRNDRYLKFTPKWPLFKASINYRSFWLEWNQNGWKWNQNDRMVTSMVFYQRKCKSVLDRKFQIRN